MKYRLTDTRRASLESRLLKLRAYLEPDKVSNIVDSVSPDQVDIKPVLDKIIKYMEGAEDSTSIKEKKAALQAALVRTAFEMGEAPHKESPMEEEKDLQNPVMHQVEDLEHELQTMDDDTLMQEIEQLEERMKQDLHLDQNSPEGQGEDEHAEAPPVEETPDSAPEEDEEMPKLAPEQKMALLMSLPEEIRAKKAASLRALANALEPYDREVSQNHNMHGDENDALMHDYEDEKMGDKRDVQAALARKVASLIKLAEETEEEEDDDKEAKASAAVVGLALRHLYASMQREAEDMPWDKEDEDDKDESDEDEKSDKDEPPFMDEKRAILQARLASMRRKANVDGKSMKTPKEVPSPEGTTEDELHGDAKIQYQNALGGVSLDEIQMKRQKLPTDKQMAGNDEPNSLYMANRPVEEGDKMTMDTDSAKDVNNKRVLKDMGEAVQSSSPASPDKQMEMGSGSHQKTKDWEKAKSESDKTPTGPRLVGLAELVKERTARAMKLAGKMSAAGLIRTEAQLTDQVIKLAEMDDEMFEKIAEFHESTIASMPKKAGEIPPQFKEHINSPAFKAHEGDPDDEKPPFEDDEEDDDEKESKTAARSIRRTANRSGDSTSVRRAAEVSNTSSRSSRAGIVRALNVGNVDDYKGGSSIMNKVAQLGWTDAVSEVRDRVDLDEIYNGHGR
jgi:hypothetical protein